MKRRLFHLLIALLFTTVAFTSKAAAPTDVKGWTFYVTVKDGGHPYSDSGSFFLALANTGSDLRIINMADVEDNIGTYTYSRSQETVGEIKLGADVVMTFVFTNASSGIYALLKSGNPKAGYQNGTFFAANGTAPTILTNRVLDFNGVIRDMPGATVRYRLITATGNKYFRVLGTSFSPTNSYTYNLLNRSTAQIYFNDAVMGEGLDRLVFTSATNGFFAYKIGTGRDYEIGRFGMQTVSAPTITTHPKDQRITIGGTATFSVVASGTAPFQYQWYKGSNSIAGATQQTLRIAPVSTGSAGNYHVTVRNFAGSTTSSNAALQAVCATQFDTSTNYAWVTKEGGNVAVNVTTVSAGCEFDVHTTETNWITSDVLDNTVTLTVASNSTATARTANIFIGNQTFVIAQTGEFAPNHLAGKTLTLKITAGSGTLPTNATALFAAATGAGNTFGLTASTITNALNGSYAFTRNGATTATITLTATNAILGTNIALSFTSARVGTFISSSPLGDQSGEFVLNERMADFNLDGYEDLFLHHTNGFRRMWLMRGTNVAPVAINSVAAYRGTTVGYADFDRDGDCDILYVDQRKLVLTLLDLAAATNNIKTVILRNGVLVPQGWSVVCAHDVNGDGSADVLLQNTYGQVAAWYFNGTNYTGAKVLKGGKSMGPAWRAIAMTDLNGDAQRDLLFLNTSTNSMAGKLAAWYFNAGEAISSEVLLNGKVGNPGWRLRAVADVNYDGYHDFLWQHTTGWIAAWHLNANSYLNTRLIQHSEFLEPWRLVGPR